MLASFSRGETHILLLTGIFKNDSLVGSKFTSESKISMEDVILKEYYHIHMSTQP